MNILFISSNRLGDAVLSSAILNAIVQAGESQGIPQNDCHITVVGGPVIKGLFLSTPFVKREIIMEKRKYSAHWWHLWQKTRQQKWDLVIDTRRSLIGHILAPFNNFSLAKNSKMPNSTATYPSSSPSSLQEHRITGILDLATRVVGAMRCDSSILPNITPKIYYNDNDMANALSILSSFQHDNNIIAIAPTANWPRKIWDEKNFIELIEKMQKYDPTLSFIIIGGKDEGEMIPNLLKMLKTNKRMQAIMGSVAFPVLSALLSECRACIANDSGLMHLAASTNIPTLGLFGPSNPSHYAPYGNHKNAVLRTDKSLDDFTSDPNYDWRDPTSLMSSIRVNDVYQQLLKML